MLNSNLELKEFIPDPNFNPKPISEEKVLRQFMDEIRTRVNYWKSSYQNREIPAENAIDGAIHSVLSIFDGLTNLPAFDIVVNPHPDDMEYFISNNEDWYEDGMTINQSVHLSKMYFENES